MIRGSRRGFTLLEVLVATSIMGIAVVTLLTALNTSMRNAARLIDHDRMAMIAGAKMDEILVNYNMPLETSFDGKFDPALTGGNEAGYHADVRVFESPPNSGPGSGVLQRIGLQVWWKAVNGQRTMNLEAFRRATIPQPVQQ